jgi:RNA polymerase sigma factor (sigma-70 family)
VTVPGEKGVEKLYAAAFPRLVRVLTLVSGDLREAEEAVQEAFIRLIPVWSKVSQYDDPEAWVRRVAVRLLSNRRRKLRNGLTANRRHGLATHAAAPSGDAIDVQRALAALPVTQRQVVVLHYLLGLDLASVAAELGIPVGTCKSRLSHARTSLQPLLSEDLHA